jgi:hypothetical protein
MPMRTPNGSKPHAAMEGDTTTEGCHATAERGSRLQGVFIRSKSKTPTPPNRVV